VVVIVCGGAYHVELMQTDPPSSLASPLVSHGALHGGNAGHAPPWRTCAPAHLWLGDADVWFLAQGKHQRPWQKLGAHPIFASADGVAGHADGVVFAVWAPSARAVAVVGDFNNWCPDHHALHLQHECGVWSGYVPGVGLGARYKWAVLGADGSTAGVQFKSDPMGRASEGEPNNASLVTRLPRPDEVPYWPGSPQDPLQQPMSVYEVHAGSWRRPDGVIPDWDTLAAQLIPYVVEMGFTHIELLPVHEHPFYASWGYQPIGLYAPSARYGSPEALRRFVATAHASGIRVILDWVPAHFPSDAYGLMQFDGTALYEHADPREGFHQDWNTLIYNMGRNEVRNFLVSNALYWAECFGVDGIRVDAVASMLYRDYSRPADQWIPNKDGGRENYEAIALLREVNSTLGTLAPGVVTVAEESTSFPGVTAPPWSGGLGFHFKWNMGWMHDVLDYFALDPLARKHHHHRISFAMMYAYSENFVLPLSHDEVVHGKSSLLRKMWGDEAQQHANLRSLYALMFAHPGKKLLFMGAELGQPTEWNHDQGLDWGLLKWPLHAGLHHLVRELNQLYRSRPALYASDQQRSGFEWIDVNDRDHSIFVFVRRTLTGQAPVVVVCNFTPVMRTQRTVGLPLGGPWRLLLDTDESRFGGQGHLDAQRHARWQARPAHPDALHTQAFELELTLPPLCVMWLEADVHENFDKKIHPAQSVYQQDAIVFDISTQASLA
jgi:1,4-alpha-glucan branching enzyme